MARPYGDVLSPRDAADARTAEPAGPPPPRPLHKVEVVGNHFAQLVVPFFLFAPQPLASIAAGIIIVTQLWLVGSGNFARLNWMAIVLAFAAVSDPVAHAVLPVIPLEWHTGAETPVWWLVVVLAVTVLLLVLSYRPLVNLFSRQQLMNASFNRWRTVNAYGAFGTVTKQRIEIVVEGTMAEEPDAADEHWLEYGFKGKPGDVRRLPRQWAPYHLRLDWLMWFLPLRTVHEGWFYAFWRSCWRQTGPLLGCFAMTRSTANARVGCVRAAIFTVSPAVRSSVARVSVGCGCYCTTPFRRSHSRLDGAGSFSVA